MPLAGKPGISSFSGPQNSQKPVGDTVRDRVLPFPRRPNDSLVDVASNAAGEPTHPSDFYSRRNGELRVEADQMSARYSKQTQILVLLGLLACVALYQSLVAK